MQLRQKGRKREERRVDKRIEWNGREIREGKRREKKREDGRGV
jgi:hypothetical protein